MRLKFSNGHIKISSTDPIDSTHIIIADHVRITRERFHFFLSVCSQGRGGGGGGERSDGPLFGEGVRSDGQWFTLDLISPSPLSDHELLTYILRPWTIDLPPAKASLEWTKERGLWSVCILMPNVNARYFLFNGEETGKKTTTEWVNLIS